MTGRRIAGLALPALGVLAAEPIYLLFDLAVVGRLGALALAGSGDRRADPGHARVPR